MRALGMLLFALIACSGTDGDVLRSRAPARPLLLLNSSEQPTGTDDLAIVRSRVTALEQLPFDGVVLDLGFGRELMGAVPLTAAVHRPAADLVATIPFRRLTDNFQTVRLSTQEWDWFDDGRFAAITASFEAAGQLVARAGMRGLFIDHQVYGTTQWAFAPENGRTFDETAAQVSARGAAVGAAILRGHPDARVLLAWGTSELFRDVCLEGQSLETHLYGLWPAFLEGFIQAFAEQRVADHVVDAYLPAYPTLTPGDFAVYAHLIHGRWDALRASWRPGIVTHRDHDPVEKLHRWPDIPALVCTPELVARLGRDRSAGFGLMLEYASPTEFRTDPAGWPTNHFTPDALESSVAAALRQTDGYVWLWTELTNPFGLTRLPMVPIPQGYVDALARAHPR